jgi:hypothetical protein
MTTLTPDEITDIRDVIGDDCEPYNLEDEQIQAQYDAAGSDLTLTYVYTLRRLWGKLRRMADRTTDHGDNETRSQIVGNTKALLDYYEGLAGLHGAPLSVGVIDLDLDTSDDTSAI